jgi:hypothetical protein
MAEPVLVAVEKQELVAHGERKATRNDVCHNCGHHSHWARDSREPRRGGAAHMAKVEEDGEPALFLAHASPEL